MNLAFVAMRIAETLRDVDLVYLADDEQQAEALAAIVAALRPERTIFFVPSSDTLPGDTSPASPANAGRRVSTLRALRLAQQQTDRPHLACILSGEAAARLYALPAAFDTAPPRLAVGDPVDATALSTALVDIGYIADDRVDEPGEMALRGEVIDVFPVDAGRPARIEVSDGRIFAIRSYDPASQRSQGELETLEVGRAAEAELIDATSILSHMTAGSIAYAGLAERRRQRFVQLARDAAGRSGRTIDAIEDVHWAEAVKPWRVIEIGDPPETVPRFAEARAPLAALARFARPLVEDGRAFVLAGSKRDLRFLRGKVAKRLDCELVETDNWNGADGLGAEDAFVLTAPIEAGFVDDRVVLVAAADLLGSRALITEENAVGTARQAFGVAEISIGDLVVHEDHGVGRIVGLEPDPAAPDGESEMVVLEHAAGARRLVAVDQTDRLWRYGGDAEAVTLDKLDGSSWLKRRGDIDAAIAESARGLTELAVAREKLCAPVLEPDPASYERVASRFPFNETADQTRAIAGVRDDLASGKPMDRLIVGDVGYGKTEVALRAAAMVALAGYQVIVAAPTTVLVRQHLESFRRRFEGTGIVVAGLSRLSTATEKRATKAGLADGSIDIVVGTGAVMGKDVTYADLGLVIIDEEQRFGATDKARLRGSPDIHLLALSATPIPRTLQMALVGLRQISIIATAPARRQPIRTTLDRYDDGRIRTALSREKERGGQSFVVVPRIEDMAGVAEKLRRIVPNLVLVQAHSKMPAAEIDEVMVSFANGCGDVLLATNIIEAGLDVPRANTMIVWRADRFGLAQLHQLRGRVGRGNRRGQVILLTDTGDAIPDRTLKRLRTLATFDRLGAGFDISAQDLDLRGAGDLLGDSQAGHTKLIGVDLYQYLLGAALRNARGEDVERWTPDLNVGPTGGFPDDWIPSVDMRVSLYVQLARIEDEEGLEAFEEELVDRFGPLPAAANALMLNSRIRLSARALRLKRIDAGPSAIALTPRHDFTGDFAKAHLLKKGDRYLLAKPTTDEDRSRQVQALLDRLGS